MRHYVIVDGILQLDSWANRRWAKRAAKQTPTDAEEPKDTVALGTDKRTLSEVVEGLDEIPEL